MPALDPQQLRFVLESAILAPSADNKHRIRFSGDGDELHILGTDPELPPAGSYRRVLALLSLGALAENAIIAATRFGVGTSIDLLPEQSRPDTLLRLRFNPNHLETVEESLWRVIPDRQTNRRLRFRGPRLTSDQQAALEQRCSDEHGTRLVWLDEPPLRRAALKLLRMAESERFRNPILHEELFSSIRFDAGWETSTEEGLPPGALGIEVPLRPFFSRLESWPIMRALTRAGVHHALGLRAADLPCRLAPHLVILSIQAQTDSASFAAGRSLERVWLDLTQFGFAVQPMAAAALYAMPTSTSDGIPQNLQRNLADAWIRLLPESQPLIALRIGHSMEMPVRTSRPPPNSFFLT